jgi:hypothetical protein
VIDPVSIGLAVAGAKTAVKLIREAISLGHDISSMTKELGSFFTAQGEVEAAAKEAEAIRKDPKRNKEKSATAIAMDCVLRAEELRVSEQELRDMFALQGKLDMYKKMCGIRANIIESRQQEIKDQARVEQQKLKKKKHSKMQSKTSFYLFLQQSLFIFCSYLVFTS